MPFINEIPETLVEAVRALCLAKAEADEHGDHQLSKWADNTLEAAIRQIEHFIEPRVTTHACISFRKNGGAGPCPLRQYAYTHRKKTGMTDLHFEHVEQVSDIRRLLLQKKNITNDEIRGILATAEIAWVTKLENKVLGRKSRLPQGGLNFYATLQAEGKISSFCTGGAECSLMEQESV